MEHIVRAAAALVRDRYVFPEKGAESAARIEARLAEGAYDGLDERELCARLTEDLRAVAPDPHLSVRWRDRPGPEPADDYWDRARLDNYGVVRVERLAGNVGYLDLRAIDEAEYTAPAITAAMALLQHTSALLLDLRHNDGGAPSGVAYLCSFFLEPEPVHLNDVYVRATDSTHQYWSYAHLPGPRYADRPLIVLIGPGTFSGGEEIAYNLQQLKRATLVGATSHGGAHPTEEHRLAPHIAIRVPEARSINPISGTNWEGVGVRPDVAVAEDRTFEEGYSLALQAVLAADPPPFLRDEAEEAAAAQSRPDSSR